jgi:hypothetical protein
LSRPLKIRRIQSGHKGTGRDRADTGQRRELLEYGIGGNHGFELGVDVGELVVEDLDNTAQRRQRGFHRLPPSSEVEYRAELEQPSGENLRRSQVI